MRKSNLVICESTASPAHWSAHLTLNDMKNQLPADSPLPQKKKPLLHLIGHCLFCKTAAVGKGQVDRNIFHSFRLFCQKLTSYQIYFRLEMKGITCAYLTSQCRFFIWLHAIDFVWGGENIFRNLFN